MSTLFALKRVSKSFSGSRALSDVDFDLRSGEVHVLFGENGAGKSTLINLMVGIFAPDSGTIEYLGSAIEGKWTARLARTRGVSAVFQEFSLVPQMTVLENLFLGREHTTKGFLQVGAMRASAQASLTRLGFDIPLDATVASLTRAQQQMVEIAKALMGDPKVLILDEPTASLTESETAVLFSLIARLRERGVGIVYVSHRMKEIRLLADRITVLRDGRKIATVQAADCNDSALVELMIGRPIDVLYPRIHHRPKAKVLGTYALCLKNRAILNISLDLHAGEIVGLAGLVGGGKSEVLRAIYGLEQISSGDVMVGKDVITSPSPTAMLEKGVCYFPADRVAEGLALSRSLVENATMTALKQPDVSMGPLLRTRREGHLAWTQLNRLNVRARTGVRRTSELSGGNRQKVMLARGLMRPTGIFLFDEPTVGIDVGAKLEVYQIMKDLAESGAAILMASSDLPEILHLSHRVYVIHRGALVAHLQGNDVDEATILGHFFPDGQLEVPA